MPWFIFFVITWLLAFVLVPLNKWKRLWPAGVIGMALIYAVDTTLIKLGAYSFVIDIFSVNGIPLLYWLSGFAGPILLLYYYPLRPLWRLPYVLLRAAVLTTVEVVVLSLG